MSEPSGAVARGRNALVYGAYAFGVLIIQLGLLALVEETDLPAYAPLCLLGLPALAWGAGWLTIGLAFKSTEGTPEAASVKRSAGLGAAICLIPNLALCCWLLALFVTR